MIGKSLLIMGIGTPEVIIILFVILLLFGAKKIPELAKGLGKGIKELSIVISTKIPRYPHEPIVLTRKFTIKSKVACNAIIFYFYNFLNF